MTDIIEPIVKKKRGRKPKSETSNLTNNITVEVVPSVPKKRGRKPKGGKLIVKTDDIINNTHSDNNIILHLKCSLSDINNDSNIMNPMLYNPNIPPTIQAYKDDTQTYKDYGLQDTNNAYINNTITDMNNLCEKCQSSKNNNANNEEDIKLKDINNKLKDLKIQLYKNTNPHIKSACFWCTYEYDNPSCYIPKYEMDNEIYGYGSFCRPECAVAFLMKESLDDSTKFERYHLLNSIYSKVYEYKNNIRPAPDPHYLLDKFYGNLTIQEYRKLLKTQHMLLVIDKPMTRILPELHDDNDEILLNSYNTTQLGTYKVKRQSEKTQSVSKNDIIKESFGLK
jgi:hypothetical protein